MEKVNSFSVIVEAGVAKPTIIHYDPSNQATLEATLGDWQAEGLKKASEKLSMNRVAYCAILKNESKGDGECIIVCKKIILNLINSNGVGFTVTGSAVIGLITGLIFSGGIGLACFAIAGGVKTAADFYMVENSHSKVLEEQEKLLENKVKEEMQNLLQN